MYKVVETDKEIVWGDSKINPLLTLVDEYGGRAQIVEDDHCLVVLLKHLEGYSPTPWLFPEAVNAIKEIEKERSK